MMKKTAQYARGGAVKPAKGAKAMSTKPMKPVVKAMMGGMMGKKPGMKRGY